MTDKETCSCCGEWIENEEIKENYEKHGLEPELRYCIGCLKNPPAPAIQELFKKIKDSLSEENKKQWKNIDRSLKSAFVLKQIENGNIQGGTIGHIEMLRSITASEVA